MFRNRRFFIPIREDGNDPNKPAAGGGGEGGGKPQEDGTSDGPSTLNEALDLIGELEEQNEKLAAAQAELNEKLAAFDKKRLDEERETLEKKGEYEKALELEKDKTTALETSVAAMKRDSAIKDAILLSDKDWGYSTAALTKYAKIVDKETEGKLEPEALLERTVEELKKLGLHGSADGKPVGGGGSPRDRQPSRDQRVEQYIKLMQQARMDPSVRPKVERLMAELRRDNIPLPRVENLQ